MNQLSQIYPISLLIVTLITLNGCSTLGYYRQAVSGHFALILATAPVEDWVRNPDTPSDLKAKLVLSQEVRTFARDQLALPVGDAFSEFVQFERPWVLVNLVAAPEFSLTPHQWCYPVIGCQAYRGYYDLEDARVEEQQFLAEGYDTFIGGVTAYSTLGWFDDPLHSGFTRLNDNRMVALMFHELAHQVVYVDQDTAFNESFATAVELEGLKLWLEQQGNPEAFQQSLERLDHRQQTLQLVEAATAELKTLYERSNVLEETEMRARKDDILDELLEDYRVLSADWTQAGPLGRDPGPLNNANLALFRQYNQHVPAFRQLFRESGQRFDRFYEAVERLSEQDSEQRQQTLADLGKRFNEHF